jgi:ABC-type glycerol-3-phosphate transport system permease component
MTTKQQLIFSRAEKKSALTKTRLNIAIGIFLVIYTVLTLFPFYTMFIRSFITTNDSTSFHLWIPKPKEFNMNAQFGSMSIYYNLQTDDFKNDMGINDYVDPNMTFNEIADEYNISKDKIIKYMAPYYTFNGWITILLGKQFRTSLFGTLFVTVMSIFLGGLLGMATGYVLAGFRKKWHFMVYNLYMLQMVIPPIMLMVPQFIINRELHLTNSYIGLILFNLRGGAIPTMIFTAFISSIPKELRESIEIDGGGAYRYFSSIVFPLCKVPFATFLTIQLPLFWNDLLYPLLFLKPEKHTLTPWINHLMGQYATNFQTIYAGLLVSVLPVLIVYLVFQKMFVRAAMSGAIKG